MIETGRSSETKERNGARIRENDGIFTGQLNQNIAWNGKIGVDEEETWGAINDA